MNLPKLEIFDSGNDRCIVWDGDQIGLIDGRDIELDITMENFENCEIEPIKAAEIIHYLPAIEAELIRLGYTVTIIE